MFLELKFKNNERISFKNFEEIHSWLEAEKNFWQWVGKQSGKSNKIRQLWQHLNQQWTALNRVIDNAKVHRNDNNFQNIINNFKNTLVNAVNSDQILLSTSPKAIFINELKEKDPFVAAFALLYFLKKIDNTNLDIYQFQGYATAFLYENALISNIDAEKTALLNLKTKFDTEYDSQLDKITELSSQFVSLKNQIEENYKKQEKKFFDFLDKGSKKLQEIEDFYNKKLALQSSVTYWKNKEELHNKLSKIFGWTSLFIIIGLAGGLGYSAYTWLLTEADKPPYWKLVIFGIIAVLGVWLARIIVRIFLSHLHLETDAKERVTMIQTYLALLREEHALKENERQVILQTLFRPSATGIVKDDGIPPSIIDIVSRFK
jgi:hypothetical protein